MDEATERRAALLKANAKREMEMAVSSTKESLDFTPPESRYEPHISRMAERCVQIGMDLALKLQDAGVPR